MKIPVIFADRTRGVVKEEDLQEMIQARKIAAFFRYDEYVEVDSDLVRGKGGRKYSGPERRRNIEDY